MDASHAEPEIRSFRPHDWPGIEEITRLIWSIGVDCARQQRYGFMVGGKSWADRKAASLKAEIDANPADWYVMVSADRVIGFCSLSADASTGIGEIGHNGMHPDFQCRGYGSRQIRFMLDELRRRGMKIAELRTCLNEGHAPARRMYERAGFEPLMDHRTYTLEL